MEWFSESLSLEFLFNMYATCNLHCMMRIQTNFLPCDLVLPNLHSSNLLRQVSKITFTKNMCKCAQWASIYMHFTTFPFFFTLSAFKNQHNCNKKKPQLPYYWITKQCVSETPLRILRASKGRCSARTPRLQEFWWK